MLSGLGAGVNAMGLGLNVISGAYIGVRWIKGGPVINYGVANGPSFGAKTSTVVASHIETDWFDINPAKIHFFSNRANLVESKVEMQLKGTLVISGTVDVDLKIYDQYGEVKEKITEFDVLAKGTQASNSSIRGNLMLEDSSNYIGLKANR